MIIPQTRREAIDLYNKRAKSKKVKTKYDMFLGGLICCGELEFEGCVSYKDEFDCTMCRYKRNRQCDDIGCDEAEDISLSMPWNGGAVG